jgi:hypothetical protein
MSRRQKTPEGTTVFYGLVELKCPHRHKLGALLVTQSSRTIFQLTPDELANFKRDEELPSGARRSQATGKLIPPGEPVRAKCPICYQQRESKYQYQQPWEVIWSYLDLELRDTRSAQRTAILE